MLGIWGAFGISFDVPKLEGSELTMEADLHFRTISEFGPSKLIPIALQMPS